MSSYANWSVEQVSAWLGSLSLHHLIPNFEKLQIDGPKLVKLSDQDLRKDLRLTKPAEVMAVRGAISKLMEDSIPKPASRRVSASPRMGVAPRDRSSSLEKRLPKTIPRDNFHRNTTLGSDSRVIVKQPKLVQGSASELLDKECKYSGWIRKQGGGYKSWKRRYLILRQGCLYYFPNETASSAKGSFVLSGYKTDICKEAEIIKRYKYTLMLIPMNPHVRTYYISVGSERELMGWKEAIDSEISSVSGRMSLDHRQSSDTMPPMGSMSNSYSTFGAPDDDDDDEDDNPYDIPEGVDDDDEHNYDDPASVIYDRPGGSDDDDDDPYTKIDDGFPTPIGRNSKPTVPSRSAFSLQSPTSATVPSSLPAVVTIGEDKQDDTYLSIIAGGPASDLAAAQPDPRSFSPPSRGVASSAPAHSSNFGHSNSDYEDDGPDSGRDDDDDDDDGGYYIMFRKPEELMPPCCIFDRLERAEADRLLKEKDRDGTYLIRGGSHAGSEKVLSVWHIDRCRHYRLFKDDQNSYSLTQGQSFRTIPELLQYYTLQSQLPRSDFYLSDPYNPADH